MKFITENWWKLLTFLLLLYITIAGFMVPVPVLDNRLQETIRNIFFHVPMWFAMMILFSISVINATRFLKTNSTLYDFKSNCYAQIGLLFGILGIITGAVWANYQWGSPWVGDPKQNGAAIALLIYFAYLVLRNSIQQNEKKYKIAAVYNIFAFLMLFPTIWILPRLSESLHPGGQGSQGNPGLNGADLDLKMRFVFYPAVIGFTLLGCWIAQIKIKFELYNHNKLFNETI